MKAHVRPAEGSAAVVPDPARGRRQDRPTTRLDLIDRKILAELMRDASLSLAQIADRVGLTQTPCWKRIQRLEAEGVIVARVALVDPVLIGFGLTVFVAVEAANHSREWRDEFMRVVDSMPEVMEVNRMAGEVDYLLRVAVRDMPAYDLFYRSLTERVALKNVTSAFSMETVRSTSVYPILEPAPQ